MSLSLSLFASMPPNAAKLTTTTASSSLGTTCLTTLRTASGSCTTSPRSCQSGAYVPASRSRAARWSSLAERSRLAKGATMAPAALARRSSSSTPPAGPARCAGRATLPADRTSSDSIRIDCLTPLAPQCPSFPLSLSLSLFSGSRWTRPAVALSLAAGDRAAGSRATLAPSLVGSPGATRTPGGWETRGGWRSLSKDSRMS